MADEDLTDLVKDIAFDTEPEGWAEEPDKGFKKRRHVIWLHKEMHQEIFEIVKMKYQK